MISVVIITYNEEANIGRCLKAATRVADEIVVVDSYSSDNTEAICKEFGVFFMQRVWEGYSSAKNFGNENVKGSYILSLDADEVLSEQLIESILDIKSSLEGAYRFNRLTNYVGKWVKHCGWYPDAKVRLFPKDKARWIGDFVHEHLEIQSNISVHHLKGDLLHYSYNTKHDHLLRIEKYSLLHAQKMMSESKKAGMVKLWTSPIFKFFKDYFFQLGFLDGLTGFTICRLSAIAVYRKYKKLRQINRSSNFDLT